MKLGMVLLLGCLVVVLFLSLALPVPTEINLATVLQPPSQSHWLGTDDLGRDVFARLLAGVQLSLIVAAGVLTLSSLIGVPLGLLAGWLGGVTDSLVGRIADMVLSFPGILLAMALTALLGGSVLNVVLCLGVLGWVGFYRLTRVQVQQLRQQPFLAAAQLAGVRPLRLAWRHLLPNVLGPLRVEALLVAVGAMVAEAGLSFLGLGIPAPTPSLGGMLRDGLREVLASPLLVVAPALVLISLTLFGHVLLRASQRGAGNGSSVGKRGDFTRVA